MSPSVSLMQIVLRSMHALEISARILAWSLILVLKMQNVQFKIPFQPESWSASANQASLEREMFFVSQFVSPAESISFLLQISIIYFFR